MKRLVCVLLLFCLVCLAAVPACASGGPAGFGLVNADAVALRKTIRGQKLIRLGKGAGVWITETGTDSRGEEWYHVRTQDVLSSGYPVRTGWIKAEFVDAGSRLWHDVQTVKAASFGMVALKNDGTVLCAGDYMFCDPGNRYAGLSGIREIGFTVACGFYAVDSRGRLFRNGEEVSLAGRVRLAGSSDLVCITEDNRLLVTYDGNTRIGWVYPQSGGDALLPHVTAKADCDYRSLLLADDGKVCCLSVDETEIDYPEPDWETWTDAVSIDASLCSHGTYVLNGHMLRKYVPTFAAVRKDGTVLAAPDELAALTAGWRGIRQVAVGADFVLGLKQDGTVLAAGIDGAAPPDVSGWTDITEISNGHAYCVGVKSDGTLVFAGRFEYGGE